MDNSSDWMIENRSRHERPRHLTVTREEVQTMYPPHTETLKRKRSETCQRVEKEEEESDQQEEEGHWNAAQHRAFVSAVFDEGMKHASPAVVMEHMTDTRDLTSERVKSRLQKFRKRQSKSKAAFMLEYDRCMTKFITGNGSERGIASSSFPDSEQSERNSGATAIALVTKAILGESLAEPTELRADGGTNSSFDHGGFLNKLVQDDVILELSMSEEERQSELGTSLAHVMAMVQPLAQIIFRGRQTEVSGKDRNATNTTSENSQKTRPASLTVRKVALQRSVRNTSSPVQTKNAWEDPSDFPTFFEVPHDEAESAVILGDKHHFLIPGQLDAQN